MGLCFYSRKIKFNLINVGLGELGLSVKRFIVKSSRFYRLYRGVSAALLLDDSESDSCPNGYRNSVGEVPVYRRRLPGCNKGLLKLSSMVVTVQKSLNWKAARLISFKRAVRQFGYHYAIDAFRMILFIFASAGMHWEVFVLLKSMIYYYATPNFKFDLLEFLPEFRCATHVVIVDALIKVFASYLMLEDAVDVYLQAKKLGIYPGIRSCNFLLKCLVHRDRKDALLALFEEMRNSGPCPNVYTYTILMNFYCNGKFGRQEVDMVEANKLLHEMRASGIRPNVVTYGTYFRGLLRSGYAEAASNLLHDLISDCQDMNVYCCNAVIDALCRQGKLDEAMRFFENMGRRKIAPDVYTFSILVRGLCESGEIEKGILLLEEMENSDVGVKPTLATYSPLLKGLCRTGRVETSLGLFRDIGNRGYKYDQLAYRILVGGFCIQDNLDCAYALLSEMITSNLVAYGSESKNPMNSLCKVGPTGKALHDIKIHTRFVNDIASGYCRKGFVGKALVFLDDMRRQGIALNNFSYSTIVNWLCKERNAEKALELIPLMLKSNVLPNVVVFSTLIYGFAQQSDFRRARTLYQNMQKFGVHPNIVTYTIFIGFYLRRGHLEMASNLYKEMILEGQYPDVVTYTIIISWFCNTGDMNKACWWFKEMYRRGCVPTVVTYTILAHGFIKKRRMDMAVRVVDEMRKRGLSPDVVTYNVLIYGYLVQGQKGLARDILVEMEKEGVLPNEHTFSTIDQFMVG